MQVLLPEGWPRPKGYANGVAATGRQVYIAGMIGWDAQGVFHSDDFAAQTRQALQNIVDVLREAGGRPEHIVRLTWYVTSANTSPPGAKWGRRFARSSVPTMRR
jgi:enamine deaminase RidA (YjgF/YER057c/UK114 family)